MDAWEAQALVGRINSDPPLRRAIREFFVSRREQRREQAEQATGETAVVLRGRCQELTAIINELCKEQP